MASTRPGCGGLELHPGRGMFRYNPDPIVCQPEAFHFASPTEVRPPAAGPTWSKLPPTKRKGPVPSSWTIRALTVAGQLGLRTFDTPTSSADQEEPFHFAIPIAATPPADVN